MDDPALGVTGIPDGWHTRSAIGINNHGTIVGNLEADGDNTVTKPFLLTGIESGTPTMTVLGPFDPDAQQEAAVKINDSGDLVVWSQKMVDGSYVDSLYVGNPGLYGEPAVPFAKVDLASRGIPEGPIVNTSIELSNRQGTSPAILAASIMGEGSNYHDDLAFRMNADGSDFEVMKMYTGADGASYVWQWGSIDLNNAGDIAGDARVYAAKGKGRSTLYAAIWPHESSEIIPAGVEDPYQSESFPAGINNDGDILLRSLGSAGYDTLLQSEWSETDGQLSIVSLIDPSDPNAALFRGAWDMTDHRANGWPTLIGQGIETVNGVEQRMLMILDPQPTSTALTTTAAVPEPASVVLCLAAIGSLAVLRRHVSQ